MTGNAVTPSVCQPSAIVRHAMESCRSIGGYNLPVDGVVLSVHENESGEMICRVRWSDDDMPASILASNLELAPGNAKFSETMRKHLLHQFEEDRE